MENTVRDAGIPQLKTSEQDDELSAYLIVVMVQSKYIKPLPTF